MSLPPPRPDDELPPAAGWEVVEPARDPILNDPLFAELVEPKPLPDLSVEPPIAEPPDDLPMAQVAPVPRATPVERPRPWPVAAPPLRRPEEPTEPLKPQVFAACAVIGCFGLGFLGAMAFIGWAALTYLSGIPDERPNVSGTGVAARPGPVGPTQMTEQKRQIPLPGRVHAVGRAAGGRYLLLHVQQTKQILVFDPNSGNLLGHRVDCGPKALFAGSASKLFVYNPNAAGEELQRWNLATGAREKAAPKPPNVLAPAAIVAGAGVDGPVYLVSLTDNGSATVRSFDPGALELQGTLTVAGWRRSGEVHVLPSDDGSVWGVTSSDGAQLVLFQPPPAQGMPGLPTLLPLPRRGNLSVPITTPARDGKLTYTPFNVLTVPPLQRHGNRSPFSFPTAHGSGLFLSLERDPVAGTLSGSLRLHVASDPDFGVDIPDVDVPRGLRATDTGSPPPDQRIHVWPAAGVAVTIPSQLGGAGAPDLQELVVNRVDVREHLKQRVDSYLVIGSEPQLWAVRGREWRYRPTVWTNGPETPAPAKLEGPAAMAVQNGELVWVPGSNDTSVDVRLSITAGTPLPAEQRFRLTVVDDADGAAH